MKEFEYKYKNYPYRILPWSFLQEDEKSWIIYRAYKLNLISSDDIKDYTLKKIPRTTVNLMIPFVSYFAANRLINNNLSYLRFLTKNT